MNNGVGFSIANRGRPVSTVKIEPKVEPKKNFVKQSTFKNIISSSVNDFKKDVSKFREGMKTKKSSVLFSNNTILYSGTTQEPGKIIEEDPIVPGPSPIEEDPIVPGPSPIEEDPIVPGPVFQGPVSNKEQMFFF